MTYHDGLEAAIQLREQIEAGGIPQAYDPKPLPPEGITIDQPVQYKKAYAFEPFNNSSETMAWQEKNCMLCHKLEGCQIVAALTKAETLTGRLIDVSIAIRMGFTQPAEDGTFIAKEMPAFCPEREV